MSDHHHRRCLRFGVFVYVRNKFDLDSRVASRGDRVNGCRLELVGDFEHEGLEDR